MTNEITWECEVCGDEFETKKECLAHEKTHAKKKKTKSKNKTFRCVVCGTSYSKKLCSCSEEYDINLTKCPHCKLENDSIKCICKQEYRRNPETNKFERYEKPFYLKGWFIFLAIIVILILVWGMDFNGTSTNDNYESTSSSASTHSFVYTSGKGVITQSGYVFTSESALKQSISAYAAGNTAESARIVATSAFEVNSGDEVTILENKLSTSKVRMTSGKNNGRTGWIPYEFIRKKS